MRRGPRPSLPRRPRDGPAFNLEMQDMLGDIKQMGRLHRARRRCRGRGHDRSLLRFADRYSAPCRSGAPDRGLDLVRLRRETPSHGVTTSTRREVWFALIVRLVLADERAFSRYDISSARTTKP